MLPDRLHIRSDVNAVDLLLGEITVDPLNLWTHLAQHAAGLLGDALALFGGQFARSGHISFDHILRHCVFLSAILSLFVFSAPFAADNRSIRHGHSRNRSKNRVKSVRMNHLSEKMPNAPLV